MIDRYDLGFDVGAEFRHDDIGPVGLDKNESGQFIANISNNNIKETSLGLYAELFNLLDNDGKDIVYLYEACVEGFDPSGLTSEDVDCATVNCRMSRATEPRTVRVGAKWLF